MSSPEGRPASPQSQSASLYNEDGSLTQTALDTFAEEFGLGQSELTQRVTFGKYEGTVADMLSDERCPVGGVIRNAYKDGGIDSVAEKLATFSLLDASFKVEISQETREAHKKKLRGKQIFPPSQSQNL